MYLCFHMHKQNVKRSAKKLMDCDGSACGTTGCDIRRDLIDIAVDQNVMLRDLNIKAVQLDGIIEVLGVVNTTQTMLFKTEIGRLLLKLYTAAVKRMWGLALHWTNYYSWTY